ncbi:Actin patches distal protein 1 [Fulvia fulva]|uniref:Actin patches distal protein 1 n=1 Tax=Passalora fulva TaxID=5499 RepID=A0A9Q8LHV7_PASFU|nr:Actin patches distal protein 1 [Fulvia fulva]KAK4623613.1 Actin patches distal protein 1 [Fulvia fulva]KAK4625888.1 Actin patches distal protein 1 [Fulvia fulva]UJO17697.1 Actin patches distal protein 1 [Fulvia fulva]WPV15482.1 Actin patches distal protein 1 [Fulvia fulva]WPV29705.1 Actin patches distal protein 1 [Fulvia fulva]
MTKLRAKIMLRGLSERWLGTPANDELKPRDDGFQTAKGIDALFPRTRPEIDGDDCLRDCASCSISYPKKFSIEEDDKLYGGINGWNRHLLVATGKTDWVRAVEDEKGSVMEAIGKHISDVDGKLMLSATNMPTPEHGDPYGEDKPTTVLLMPSFTFVDNVTPKHVPELIRSVINTAPTNTTPLPQHSLTNGVTNGNGSVSDPASIEKVPMPSIPKDLPAGLSLRTCPHKYIILICSQATRDARCGQSAPLLKKELERQLRPLGLYRDLDDTRPGGVGLYFISHTGGHKYSANMMVYRKAERSRTVQEQINGGAEEKIMGGDVEGEAAQCIWLARIRPEDCENVVRYTVLQGKVVKPERQLRGGFDRERGVVSW